MTADVAIDRSIHDRAHWRSGFLGRRVFVIGLALLYTVIYLHTPLAIHAHLPHDDTLFMRLGRYLAEGRWLGPYDQFTLMKGPGFPAFLALANWLGISVSLAFALFHCAAIIFFTVIAHRFMKSLLLSGLLFVLLLWHPIALGPFLLRIIRESIYYGQALIFLAAFAWMMLGAAAWKERAFYGALSGAMLGWFWLTREEGIWLFPAIAILLVGGLLRGRREGTLRSLAGGIALMVGLFAATQVAFQAANWRVYGKFVGVDFKEKNFQRALGALNSVLSGGNLPFVPVSRMTRERIYAISPSFGSLAIYLERDIGAAYDSISCPLQPTTCGHIGSSVFMWALRDAAWRAGHYASPAKASEFFGRMADEITQGCGRRALECNPQFIAEVPQIYRHQFSQLPQGYLTALNLLLMLRSQVHLTPSAGTAEELAPHLRFLHFPRHTPPTGGTQRRFRLLGWFYKSGADWITVTAPSQAGLSFQRQPSPDIASGFKDAAATQQRYLLELRCNDDCVLQFATADGARVDKRLGEIARASTGFDIGGGRLHVDMAEREGKQHPVPSRIENLAGRIREAAINAYNFAFLPVLGAGLLTFLFSTLLHLGRGLFTPSYVVAAALWATIFTRVTMLVVVEATWIPPIFSGHSPYLTSLYFLIVAAAVLSIAAWGQLRGLVPTTDTAP